LGKAVAASRRLFAKAARVPLARGVSPRAVETLSRRPGETQLGVRLEQFFSSMRGPYVVAGRRVEVTPHFRSLLDSSRVPQEKALGEIKKALGSQAFAPIALSARRATSSRGSAKDVRIVTQALIDAGALEKYSGADPARAIRRLMWDLGIGLDCRGYVAQAFLYSRGKAGTAANGAPYGLSNPGHFVFPTAAMKKVDVAQARAGDIIRLAPVDGRDHNVIVRSIRTLRLGGDGDVRIAGRSVPLAFLKGGWPTGSVPSVRVLEVDSAWGGGLTGDRGGVQRRIWLHNERSGQWAHWDQSGEIAFGRGPYGHELMGIYRPKDE